jgi:1,4-dihydroxy-2-naphthoate octaprenyltransferase
LNNPETHSNIKIWLLATRPKTLWAAVAPVIIGTAMAYDTGGVHWISAAAALVSALFIQIGTNLSNDFFDFRKGADTQNRLGPVRVTQAGLLAPEKVKAAAHIAFKIAFLIGIYLVIRGGWPIVIIGLLSIFFGIIYTGGPYPLGYNGLGEIFVLIFFGPVAVGGTYYVQTLEMNWEVIAAGFSPGLLAVAILTVNNLRDIESDDKAGKKTLAVRLGKAYAQFQYVAAIILAAVIPLLLWLRSAEHIYALFTLIIIAPALPAFKKVFGFQDGAELNKVLEFTGQLLLLYSVLFSIGWIL